MDLKALVILSFSILSFLMLVSLIKFANGLITCSIATTCFEDNTILRVSSNINAHAGSFDSSYALKVCCPGIVGRACLGNNNILRIENTGFPIINVHAEKNSQSSPNYIDVCFGGNQIDGCTYKSSCDANELCLGSIDTNTNGHLAECNFYSEDICCKCSPLETSCTDGLDNDCDGTIDCTDLDCAGTINGNVILKGNGGIDNARVDVLEETDIRFSGLTNPSGDYNIANVLCGTYNLIASSDQHLASSKTGIILPPNGIVSVNFELVLGSTCESDCTYAGDNLIHAECDGRNRCSFIDNIARDSCNLAQPGWIRAYDSDNNIQCSCIGDCEITDIGPLLEKSTEQVLVTCDKGNLFKITKIVVYKGKPVNMVIAVCR